MEALQINKEVNSHFEDLVINWDYKTYLAIGGYGSSKSYHVALKIILKLLEEKRKILVIRQVFETMRDSSFSLLLEIIEDMDIEHLVKATTSPMKLEFANGSEVIFKGMDSPKKLKSINNVSIIWIEECSELNYEGYKELLGRARHPYLSIHFILTTNPIGEENWVYKHFFKDEEEQRFVLDDEELYRRRIVVKNNTYYHHSIAEDNHFLPYSYIEQLDELKSYDPDLYRVARLGKFGISGTRVLPQFEVIDHEEALAKAGGQPAANHRVGMDFGFITSYNALISVAVDDKKKELIIYDEYYKRNMTDDRTKEEIKDYKKTLIRADSAEPKTIQYYNQEGFTMIGAKKWPGSRKANTKKIKRFKKIYCSDQCVNVIRELKPLTFKTNRDGQIIEDEFNIDAHTLEAIWYALDGYEVTDLKDRKNYSGKGRRS